MVKLRELQLGDEVYVKDTSRWKKPFIVEVIHRGYIVAVNRQSKMFPVFLFIKTFANEAYTGSSRFLKYGIYNKASIKEFINGIVAGDYKLEKDTCVPINMLLADRMFIQNEKREQVRYAK